VPSCLLHLPPTRTVSVLQVTSCSTMLRLPFRVGTSSQAECPQAQVLPAYIGFFQTFTVADHTPSRSIVAVLQHAVQHAVQPVPRRMVTLGRGTDEALICFPVFNIDKRQKGLQN